MYGHHAWVICHHLKSLHEFSLQPLLVLTHWACTLGHWRPCPGGWYIYHKNKECTWISEWSKSHAFNYSPKRQCAPSLTPCEEKQDVVKKWQRKSGWNWLCWQLPWQWICTHAHTLSHSLSFSTCCWLISVFVPHGDVCYSAATNNIKGMPRQFHCKLIYL